MAGPFIIEVSGDVAGVVTLPKQLRFAATKANNDTGTFAQDEIIRELDDELVLRGTWFRPRTRFGINKQNGRFSDAQPEVQLFTRADWLLEEEGFNRGLKKAEEGRLADPEDPVTRGPITAKFPRSQKAGRLLANSQGRISAKTGRLIGKTGAFVIQPKNNPNIQLVFQRVGTKDGQVKLSKKGIPLRGRVKGGNSTLVLKHILKKSVRVPTPKIFQNTAINTYRVWYPTYFGRSIVLALRTAKL